LVIAATCLINQIFKSAQLNRYPD